MTDKIAIFKFNKELLTNVKQVFNDCIENNYVEKFEVGFTNKGIQTKNVQKYIDIDFLNHLNKLITEYIKSYYSDNLNYSEFYVDHIHLIKYHPGGHQIKHNHGETDDHSFILYLNDSDGSTLVYNDTTPLEIKPEEGKLVVFNGAITHEALPCSEEKMVAVGRINFLYKIWKRSF